MAPTTSKHDADFIRLDIKYLVLRIAIDLISQHIADYLANPQTSRLAQPESPAVVALMDTRKRLEKTIFN